MSTRKQSRKQSRKLTKRASNSKSGSDSHYIPRYEIINRPSFASLVVHLKPGQTVVDRYGYMNYFDSSIKLDVKMLKGFMGAFKFATGGDAFENFYTGTTTEESKVCFGGNTPGDIIPIIINPDDAYTFDRDNLLCYSPNLKFETTFRFKNIIGGGDVMLTKATLKEGDKGIMWLHTNGSYQKLQVDAGKSVKVETGFFIVAKSEFQYKLAKLGGLKTMMFGGEGAMYMEFTGPGVVYIHSRNRRREIQELRKAIGPK